MPNLRLGILPWSQSVAWAELLDVGRRVERLGYQHVWAWDHLFAIFGDPAQPIFEGWQTLAAWAMATEKVQIGLMVGANTFRNPGLVAKTVTTLDHISGGRAILGLGGAWFEPEHTAHGIPFGRGFGERLDWLDESVAACRTLLDGGTVTSAADAHYAFRELHQEPLPVQKRLPIMIGGTGRKKTLRTVARYADMWNAQGTPAELAEFDAILQGALPGRGAGRAGDRAHGQPVDGHPRHGGRGALGVGGRDGPQQDAAGGLPGAVTAAPGAARGDRRTSS